MAYQIDWKDKQVLVSGRIPTRIDQASVEQLIADLNGPLGDPEQYYRSMMLLSNIEPDIWLPAKPIHDQNANVYANQWPDTIRDNQGLFEGRRR